MLGGFSEEALQLFQLAASEQSYEFSEEGETYDFTRCMRADGTFYGTSGTCRKGSDAGAKKETPRQRRNRDDRESPKNKADMDHAGLKKLMAKSPTAQRQLKEEAARKEREAPKTEGGVKRRATADAKNAAAAERKAAGAQKRSEHARRSRLFKDELEKIKGKMRNADDDTRNRLMQEASDRANKRHTAGEDVASSKKAKEPKAPAAKKPRATVKELRKIQEKLYDEAKALRAKEKETLAEWKRVSLATKGDKSAAGKKARLEAGRAADKAAEAARRAENAWSRAHERWSKAGERANRAKMTPAQRAEARRVDKIIKERG